MKLLKILILLILIANVSTAYAEVKTFTAVGEYTMSDYESPDIAEQRALDYARRSAAEQAGVYLENYSRSKNFKLVEDEIKTVASDNIEIIDKKVTRKTLPPNDIIYFRVEITASVDTGYIDGVLKKKHEDRQKAIRAYEDLKKKQEEMDKHIAELKEKIAKIESELPDEEISEEQDRRDRDIELEYPQAQHGTEDAEHRAGERKERQAYLTKMVQKQYQHHCQRCNDRPEYLRQEYLIHFRQATIRDRYTLR